MQQVPQFIETKDKIAGPFTLQQLLWLGGAVFLLVIAWQLLLRPVFYVIAIPTVILTGLFAFLRPHNMSFIQYLQHVVFYFLKPRIYLWQRETITRDEPATDKPQEVHQTESRVSTDDVAALTEALDSHGKVRDEHLQALIAKNLARATAKKKSS